MIAVAGVVEVELRQVQEVGRFELWLDVGVYVDGEALPVEVRRVEVGRGGEPGCDSGVRTSRRMCGWIRGRGRCSGRSSGGRGRAGRGRLQRLGPTPSGRGTGVRY